MMVKRAFLLVHNNNVKILTMRGRAVLLSLVLVASPNAYIIDERISKYIYRDNYYMSGFYINRRWYDKYI
jgi:hypothetical protein